ncbi:TonB family protein [Pseudoalteromonas phenolica]|uniref:TonB family protein n=1 Tax=Pseudoalteromonas phenolica TaxID=161398 RepID=UPI0038512079
MKKRVFIFSLLLFVNFTDAVANTENDTKLNNNYKEAHHANENQDYQSVLLNLEKLKIRSQSPQANLQLSIATKRYKQKDFRGVQEALHNILSYSVNINNEISNELSNDILFLLIDLELNSKVNNEVPIITHTDESLTATQASPTRSEQQQRPLTPVKVISPQYPAMSKKMQHEGYVTMQFDIDTNGKPINIEIIEQQPQRIFNREAIRAFKQWRYPANNPLTAQKVRIDFQLP